MVSLRRNALIPEVLTDRSNGHIDQENDVSYRTRFSPLSGSVRGTRGARFTLSTLAALG